MMSAFVISADAGSGAAVSCAARPRLKRVAAAVWSGARSDSSGDWTATGGAALLAGAVWREGDAKAAAAVVSESI